MATAQAYYDNRSVVDIAREDERSRNIKRAQAEQQRKQKEEIHMQQIAQGVNTSRQNIPQNQAKTQAQQKHRMRKVQQFAHENINDTELHNIADNVADTFSSSKAMLPIKISKLAYDSRAALTDYKSKWWVLAFTLAFIKDGFFDFAVLPGYALSIYFFIFLFGGGFVKKYLKKKIAIFIILFLVGFIPGLNVIIPETLFMVFLRWYGSQKAAEKGADNLKIIKKKYSEYDNES